MSWASATNTAFLLVLTFGGTSFGSGSADFRQYVPSLSSENGTVQEDAVKHLRELPDLHSQLQAGLLSKESADATRVIRALHDVTMTDAMISFAQKVPSTDAMITLLSLLSPETREQISAASDELLNSRNDEMPAGSIIAGLNILSSTDHAISAELAQKFLNSDSYEVRIALMSYVGHLLSVNKGEPYLGLLSQALKGKPYQLRLQALAVAKSLAPNQFAAITSSLESCSSDLNMKVRSGCKKLLASHRGDGR
jgi:hypothetical protein